VNPAGGCLPMVIQFPVFIILYDVIRGLTNTVKVHGHVVAAPRYIGHNTSLYKNLVKEAGKMPAFGLDLAQKVLGHKSVTAAIPYALLIVIAIGLQYLQMRQLNSRNPGAAQANPQAQMMQRYMPLIFAVIYINISAGVNIYFIVSSLCRIGLQEAVFRSGVLDRAKRPAEGRLPGAGAPKRKTLMERLGEAQQRAFEAQKAREAALQAGDDGTSGNGKPKSTAPPGGRQGQSRTGGKPGTGGARTPPSPPQAKDKRTRKAR